MNRRDFTKITGADRQSTQYLPVAFLLRSGYGCAGYYNSELNTGIDEMCVLLNARVVCLHDRAAGGDPRTIKDFSQFLEEVVTLYNKPGGADNPGLLDAFGKSIPLTAVPFSEIAVFYPVAQIGQIMQAVRKPAPTPEPAKGLIDLNETDLSIEITPGLTPPLPPARRPAAATTTLKPAITTTSKSTPRTTSPKSPAGSKPTQSPSPQSTPPTTPTSTSTSTPTSTSTSTSTHQVSTFFDFNNKSVVLQALRTKLW